MNRYVIAPKVVKLALDPVLTAQFRTLNGSLRWRTLTTNLESCESPPYLYFRVSLQLKAGNTTYAGFATGAPFMLTRDKNVSKRAFFLRHWVRSAPEQEKTKPPLVNLPHMALAAEREDVLLIRVNIDRPLASEDIFKSIPFATWMFQVVQVDAVIQELPGIRFAFAIERTVTTEERELVTVRKGLPLTPQQLKAANSVLPRPSSIPSPQSNGSVRQTAGHSLQPSRQHSSYSPVTPRPPAAAYQPNPYAYSSGRALGLQMRQNVSPRVPYHTQHQPVKLTSRAQGRSGSMGTGGTGTQSNADNLRPVLHPYLRLWEDRDLDDPYEPIFVTEDDEFDRKARKSWLVEDKTPYAEQFEYQNLFGVPSSDYPMYYFKGPSLSNVDGEPDIEVIVQRKQQVKVETSEVSGASEEINSHARIGGSDTYSSAVLEAAQYNSILRRDRTELRKWLVEDVQREGEESEQEEDEEDGDGDYSD